MTNTQKYPSSPLATVTMSVEFNITYAQLHKMADAGQSGGEYTLTDLLMILKECVDEIPGSAHYTYEFDNETISIPAWFGWREESEFNKSAKHVEIVERVRSAG